MTTCHASCRYGPAFGLVRGELVPFDTVGYALLTREGFTLIAADDPDAFTADTPTARMVRQILGAVAEFEKANLVAKLRGARDRKAAAGKRVEGRKGFDDTNPELVKQE
jgi:DNA invertase Pin-like site-specific DNA recombinase